MFDKKVLIFSTYPIEEPLHGGQKRTTALVELYKTLFKEVKFIAVFYDKYYKKYGPLDIPIRDEACKEKMDRLPFASDVVSGDALYEDAYVRERLKRFITEYRPDVIQVEQTYPYIGLSKLLEDLEVTSQIILSSHNIETEMKAEILQGLGLDQKEKSRIIRRIRSTETEVSQKAKVVITVSKSDADQHYKMGAKKCVVAPNGISKVIPTEAAIQHWRKFKGENSIDSLVTFVGSAHPPNLSGFRQMMGEDLTFLPPTTHLALAGGISEYMQEELKYGTKKFEKFWHIAEPLGRLSDDNLAGLIQESEVIILPITSGGGSNLKTAEAILCGKKVVATSRAFRSFEHYINLPNIFIGDTPEEFRRGIVDALNRPFVPRTPMQQELASEVTWNSCLALLPAALEKGLLGWRGVLQKKTRAKGRAVYRRSKNLVKRIANLKPK